MDLVQGLCLRYDIDVSIYCQKIDWTNGHLRARDFNEVQTFRHNLIQDSDENEAECLLTTAKLIQNYLENPIHEETSQCF